ncbi:MAG TPA: TauD/TfdA family dioxygenase [Thermoanaerobaculia bacterium]|nr:TauD/TfdA family dioxygenase [Thermoanaerobaculia bacterium]
MFSTLLLPENWKRLVCDGYCVLNNVDAEALLPIARELGHPHFDPRDRVLVKDIRPQPVAVANANTLSSRYGMGAFPLHTEAAYLPRPPRFLLLYCVRPGSGGRTTILLDAAKVFSRISCRRRLGTWVVKAGRRPFLCHALWGSPPKDFGIRYDRECLFPRGPAAQAEDQLISDFISRSTPTKIVWTEKKLLVVDNLRMLHGRGEANDDDRDRWLKRVLVAEEALNGLGF